MAPPDVFAPATLGPLSAGSSLLNPMYLFRGDAPRRQFDAVMPLALLGGITTRATLDLAMAEGFEYAARARPA